jgi:hypothetical protein
VSLKSASGSVSTSTGVAPKADTGPDS